MAIDKDTSDIERARDQWLSTGTEILRMGPTHNAIPHLIAAVKLLNDRLREIEKDLYG